MSAFCYCCYCWNSDSHVSMDELVVLVTAAKTNVTMIVFVIVNVILEASMKVVKKERRKEKKEKKKKKHG